MGSFIIRRIIQAVFVFLIVTFSVFISIRMLPGDPILVLISQEEYASVSDEQIEKLRHEFGLDRSVIVQYTDWLSHVFRGDLGTSITYRVSVADEILKRLPITLHLGVTAMILSIIIGTPLGILSAVRRGGWLDNIVTTLANVGITIPSFWLGVMMVYMFALYLGLLPVCGYTSPFDDLWLSTRKLVMPAICLAVFPMSSIARQTRSSMLEVMGQDYIRTAWAKGLKERLIIARHALKNALIPVVTLIGFSFRNVVGGSVLIESVFNIPGMGRMAVESILSQDYAFVQGIILVLVTAVLLVNLIVDLSYGWLDPRIRYD